jgi:hypothetical protein
VRQRTQAALTWRLHLITQETFFQQPAAFPARYHRIGAIVRLSYGE